MEGFVFSSVNYVIPSVCWSKHKMKHWFSDSTIKLIHRKKQLYCAYKRSGNPATLKKYKSFSNLVRLKCHQETASHSNLVCQQSQSNPKQFWRWVNTLKGYRNPIPSLMTVVIQSSEILIKHHYLINTSTWYPPRRIPQILTR